MKYDYCLLCRIAATRFDGRSVHFMVRYTRNFRILSWFIVVLTREAPKTLASIDDDRTVFIVDRFARTRAPFSTSGHKYSGRRQQGAQTLEKACDPAVRGIVEIWFVLRESLIADCKESVGDCKFSFHSASNSSGWKSFSKFNYIRKYNSSF